jgi:hypothetical protein
MHRITEMPAWERLFKRIVWAQIGDSKGFPFLTLAAVRALLLIIMQKTIL